jgi:hypothetical protein
LHAGAYLLANITSRREIHRKQGRALGVENVPVEPIFAVELANDIALPAGGRP